MVMGCFMVMRDSKLKAAHASRRRGKEEVGSMGTERELVADLQGGETIEDTGQGKCNARKAEKVRYWKCVVETNRWKRRVVCRLPAEKGCSARERIELGRGHRPLWSCSVVINPGLLNQSRLQVFECNAHALPIY
jgi:hypothetical protein